MPVSPFEWACLPDPVLAALAEELQLDPGNVVEALGASFGATPRASFVRVAWPVLRDVWLAGRPELRADLASALREAGVGDTAKPDDAEFLATCPNTKDLRDVVLTALLEAGAACGPDVTEPAGRSEAAPPAAPMGTIEIASIEQLDRATEMVLEALDGEHVSRNGDGDLLLAHGSALTFVRPAVEPPRLHFASPLLAGVPESPELIGRLNDINAQIAFGRLFHRDSTVVAEMELICRPFVPEHVAIAANIMSRLADEVDDMLQDEFGGKTFFGDAVPPKVAETYGYGGYL